MLGIRERPTEVKMADGSLALTGVDNRGEQRAKLEYKVAPKDILVFVPGTTDPVNTTKAQHDANKSYWDENKRMLEKVANLRKEFLDLHVCMDQFSWSGDNAQAERVKAGGRLRDLLYARQSPPAMYAGWRDKPVWLHLIGHSHGGNVINEFTKQIKAAGDFPQKWKIKSVTYLSTPFFKKLHQLDTTYFHPECQVLNVYNMYDLTQRVIADFTMQQMPGIIERVAESPAVADLKLGFSGLIESIDGLKQWGYIDDSSEGPIIWRSTAASLGGINRGLKGVKVLIDELGVDYPDVFPAKPKRTLHAFLDSLIAWCTAAVAAFRARLAAPVSRWSDHYNTALYISDLSVTTVVNLLNGFLAFDPATMKGTLFDVLDEILLGRIDVVDDTTASPVAQVPSKYPIHDIPVKKYDPYTRALRDRQFSRFITRAEQIQALYVGSGTQRNRMDLILLLIAQFDESKKVDKAALWVKAADIAFMVALKMRSGLLANLSQTLMNYRAELIARRCDIVVSEEASLGMEKQRGNIAYLAKTSHSISRQDIYPEVREKLIPTFGSGKNPAYQVAVKK
jgi:hypothetical protein